MRSNTKKTIKCPPYYIVRNAYTRKTKKYKTKIHVKEGCIKSRGLPGKTSLKYIDKKTGKTTGIGALKKGELGKYGYHNVINITPTLRHRYLKNIVREYGARKIVNKLGALRTYLKNTSPKHSSIFHADQRWVRRVYDSEFKGSLKNSKLFSSRR